MSYRIKTKKGKKNFSVVSLLREEIQPVTFQLKVCKYGNVRHTQKSLFTADMN